MKPGPSSVSAHEKHVQTDLSPRVSDRTSRYSFRTLPPAGTILRPNDLVSLLTPVGSEERRRSLETGLATRFHVPEVRTFSSGRAAMTVVLGAMAELRPDRPVVVVPGYTCFSVAASVVRAGLRLRPVDIDLNTLTYCPSALEAACDADVLCIVSANLFGEPDQLGFLERLAAEKGVFFLDDAAQALQATVDDRMVGTFGDAGILSFDKGKNITTIEGGAALLQNPDLKACVTRRWEALPRSPLGVSAGLIAKALIYAVFLRPRLYWLPARSLRLGGTPFETDFPVTQFSAALAPLAESLLARVDEITEARRTRARWLTEVISLIPDITAPTARSQRSVHLRFPILLSSEELRDRAIAALSNAGLGATQFYPAALTEIPQLRDWIDPNSSSTPDARSLARRILTLPTHEYVERRDVESMGDVLSGLA